MGDRISIEFRKDGTASGVLFSHWDGMAFKQAAEDYVRSLVFENLENKRGGIEPLDRLEPDTVMVSFISEIIGKGKRIVSNYYLPPGVNHGDNSDNGHHVIDIDAIEADCKKRYQQKK